MTTTTLLKTTVSKFKLGEEFDEERADGAKVRSLITLDGNTMTHVMKGIEENVPQVFHSSSNYFFIFF